MTTIAKLFARQLIVGVTLLLGLTVILGVAYPAGMWVVSRIGATSAEGSQITDARGCNVGSSMIGVDPRPAAGEADWYLHARVVGSADDPMATGDPSASASSNLGPNNPDLVKRIEARRNLIATRDGVAASAVPVDAVTGSASGLDPQISEAYADIQVARIAREGHLDPHRVRDIIAANTDDRQWGFLGQPRVNVTAVNIGLGHVVASCG